MNNSTLIECVPNISIGRNHEAIMKIKAIMESNPQVKLLHTDIGFDANRTVFTLVGNMEIFRVMDTVINYCSSSFSMESHHGVHPRIGMIDVCPFIAIAGITEKELINEVSAFAKSIGDRYQFPIYLYEKSATSPARSNLAYIRKGGYESLNNKRSDPTWAPDYGSWKAAEKMGAMVLGVRPFLIAFNINLCGNDLKDAQNIAKSIRWSSRFIKDLPFKGYSLPGIKAIGWRIEAYNCAQVSTNITDFHKTGIHELYETVKKLGRLTGAAICGSELIGMVPLKALLDAGRFYLGNGKTDPEYIAEAIDQLGLESITKFVVEDRILEYKIKAING